MAKKMQGEIMNKTEFIEIIAKRTQMPQSQINKIFKISKDTMIEVLNKGGVINLHNFGKIEMQETPKRLYRNPITKRLYYSGNKKIAKIRLFKNFKYIAR